MRVLKDSAVTLGALVLGQLISMLVAIVVTRSLGLEVKGQISLFLSLPGVLVIFAMLGGPQACIFHLGKGNLSLDELIPAAWVLSLAQTVVIILMSIPVWLLLRDNLLRGMDLHLVLFVMALLPAGVLFEYTVYMLRGVHRPFLYNLYRVVRSAIYLLIVLILCLMGQATVGMVLVAWAVGLLGSLILSQRSLLALRPGNGHWSLSSSVFAKIISYGIQMSPTLILAWLGYRFDVFIVNSLLDKSSVGVYSIAVSIAEIAWFVPNAIGIVIFPMISSMTKRQANEFTPLVLRQTLAVMLVACLALVLGGRFLITLAFGRQAEVAVTSLFLLLPGIFIFAGLKVIWQDQCGRGYPLDSLAPMIANVLVDVGLCFVLIPRLGINGAALASSISYSSAALMTVLLFTRRTGLSVTDLILPTGKDYHLYLALLRRVGLTLSGFIASARRGKLGQKMGR